MNPLETAKAGSRCGTSAKTLATCETGIAVLWTILVVLCVLWLLGMVTSYTLGGFIHILLLVALVIFVINLFQGRRRVV